MRFRLTTLGEAGLVEDGGVSVDFPIGKPFGILAYLSLSSDPVSRDELAAVFWNGGDRSRARHSLRQALSFIRRRLGDDIFATDDPLVVEPAVLETDVDLLRQALRDADTDRILALYQGPFLETFQLASSPEWDHWVEIQRRILEERVAAALREAAAREEDTERAVLLLQRVVEVEPHRVGHRVALVECFLARGDVDQATAVVAVARQSDVVDPGALDGLAERVRAVREQRTRTDEGADVQPEFVGRTVELAALTAAWREAAVGHRQIAILNGPTGIGKTRLASELGALISGTGRVAHVKASSMERRLAWSVTAELTRALYRLPGAAGVGERAMGVLRSLVPSLGGSTGPSPTASPQPVAISDALVDLVSAVTYESPVLIILDDMQWVDQASLALLLRTIRQVRDQSVMVVLTFRSEELGGREYNAIRTLAEQENASVHLLRTLGEPAVEEMLTLDLAEPPERIERLAAQLHEVTRGHPLFLVELLRSLRDEGILVRDHGGWRFAESGPVQLELPASVRVVINRRIERLGDAAREVGAQLASLPPSAGLGRVRGRTGLSDAEFTAGVSELLDRAVVEWDPAGRLAFTHDQLREAMPERKPRRTRRTAAVVLVAAAMVAALAVAVGGTTRADFGGGKLLIRSGDSLLVLDGPGGPDTWSLRPSDLVPPRDSTVYSGLWPRRLTDGTVAWVGSVHGGDEAPEGAVFRGHGMAPMVLEWPGDDGVQDISPDGRYVLWATEHRETPGWDLELRIRELANDGPGLVAAGPGSGVQGRWSPDGMRVAVALAHERDSLLVLSPAGRRLYTSTAFQINIEQWCTEHELLAVIKDAPTAEFVRYLIDTRTGSSTVLDHRATQSAVCSPDGAFYVSRELIDGRRVPVLTEIAKRKRWRLPTVLADLGRIYWLPDAVGPIPARIRLARDSATLKQGEQAQLETRLVLSDGSERPIQTELVSSDPAVVSTQHPTRITANRTGTARVTAHFEGWLADTLLVRVVPNERSAAVLADDFRWLDTLRWMQVGEPTAAIRKVDGRNVLELLGDGRYSDGLVSRDAKILPGGATVELEFQMPLTRDEYQGFILRLGAMEPPAGHPRTPWSAWSTGEIITLLYPAFELDKWSPRLVQLHAIFGAEAIEYLPEESDPAQWTHLALQVQADGLVSVWIDRQFVASIVTPPGFLDQPLRVAIFGRTRDTHGYVRNFTWWAEPRFQ